MLISARSYLFCWPPAGRGFGGVSVHGLCGRDILELDGCGSCALNEAMAGREKETLGNFRKW